MVKRKKDRPLMAWFREIGGEPDCTISRVRPKRGKALGVVAVPEYLWTGRYLLEDLEKTFLEVWNAAVMHTEKEFAP